MLPSSVACHFPSCGSPSTSPSTGRASAGGASTGKLGGTHTSCYGTRKPQLDLDHVALRPQKRGCLLGTGTGVGGVGRGWGWEDERVKARPRIPPEKDRGDRGPPPLRRCPLAIAQRLVHCAIAVSTAVLGRVTRTVSVALLLRNNPRRKKSYFRSPAPPPCS